MKKFLKVLIFSVILLNYSVLTAQDIALDWAKAMGGTLDDVGLFITTDTFGNIYTTGLFGGTVDFDPSAGTYNLTSAGGYDIFVQKLDASGNFIWAKAMGGISNDHGYSINTDASGNIYTTGNFGETADFDPSESTYNLTSAGSTDIFIQKLDASGNFVWAKAMGGYSEDFGNSISTDTSGNSYTTGYFYGTVDFDPSAGTYNLVSAGHSDIFVQKLDTDGNFVWAKTMGGTFNDYGNSISTDASGNIYTTGYFNGTVDFDPSAGTYNLTSAGNADIFIQKLGTDGNFVWAKAMGGTDYDEGNSISTDASGNIYTTGYFNGTVDFDPSAGTYNLTSAGYDDIFVQKLDTDGNFVWAKAMGGTDYDESNSISTDASGNIYTTGNFTGTVDFDPSAGTYNLTSAGNYDIFVQKLDTDGNFVWAKAMGGTDYDRGYSITTDASGNIYTTGFFRVTANFDPSAGTYNLTSAGYDDIFVAKYSPTGTSILDLPTNGISIYPNPTSGKLTIDNGQLIIKNIEITDITGKTIQSFSNSQIKQFSNYEIDLSGFESGIYFVKIQTDKDNFVKKVSKK
jgi:hypothetical protein